MSILSVLCKQNNFLWLRSGLPKVLLGCLLISSCKSSEGKVMQGATHTVIKCGEVLEFKNPNGTGKIHYLGEFKRRFDILGSSFEVTFIQREQEWRHQKGIYNPGEAYFHGAGSTSLSSSPRFVVEESDVEFSNADEVDKFLNQGGYLFKWVANEDGYVVGYFTNPARDQISVVVYRFYLNGKIIKSIPKKFQNAGSVIIKQE